MGPKEAAARLAGAESLLVDNPSEFNKKKKPSGGKTTTTIKPVPINIQQVNSSSFLHKTQTIIVQQAHNNNMQPQRQRPQSKQHQQQQTSTMSACLSFSAILLGALLAVGLSQPQVAEARITFEKMTNRDYSGITYYSIQNVSLFECLGWCKEESSCTSAVFSFVVNPFAALQETTCQLQNETQARQTAYLRSMGMAGNANDQVTVVAHPQKATNLYFFNKIELPTESVCSRLWAFERFPNRRLRQRDRQPFHVPNKEACLTACMNEQRFVCRSLEYNYISQQCTLNGYDRRSPLIIHLAGQASSSSSSSSSSQLLQGGSADLIESAGTDYFENACLLGEDICTESRIYDYAKTSGLLSASRVAHFVELNYYPDKEMLVKSQAGCVRACTIEHEFICRSILYRSSFKQGQPNCALYHLDQRTFPDGAETFMAHTMQPLLDSGETSAIYLEAICNDTIQVSGSSSSLLSQQQATTISMLPPSSITILPSSTTPGNIQVHAINNHSRDDDRYIQSSSSSTLSPIGFSNGGASTTIRLPTTFLPPSSSPSSLSGGQQTAPNNIRLPIDMAGMERDPQRFTIRPGVTTQRLPGGNEAPHHLTISPAPPTNSMVNQIRDELNNGGGGGISNHDQNCDAHGFCYDVALKCTDTKMIVNVRTQKPFHGRIYALGRSETCNANIKNQNQFQLDMFLTGQDCNTQSASGTYTNTIVLQHHNVVLTKADKVYHVRCTYETASRNVSFGMMPVKDMFEVDVNDRNQETISITASSDAPLPKISILTQDNKEASTVRIGDRLTFRIEIPDNTPYGIFARSCIAMAKDARSTFEIIDENGCPVDHTIFPSFIPAANGNALESNYEAFRFTESYGVIFQCNVKYCIGKCMPVNCGIGRDSVEAWGRKKRSVSASSGNKQQQQQTGKQLGDDMTLSREIVVLDLKEKDPNSTSDGGDLSSSTADKQAAAQEASSGLKTSSSAGKSSSAGQNQHSKHHNHQDAATAAIQGDEMDPARHCLSRQSIFVLFTSIGFFFVLYMCVVACFFARRDPIISPIKHQYH